MCKYTDLATLRGFSYWLVVYPSEGSTRVVVGLTNSDSGSPEEIFGTDFSKQRLIGEAPMAVKRMQAFCGTRR
jgi:hypothetical protein